MEKQLSDNDPLDWEQIIKSTPWAQEGYFNSDRKKLLKPGVSVNLHRWAAESWISELRIKRETAQAAAEAQGKQVPAMNDPVRVKIIEVPEITKADPVSGEILVEADGVRATIDASVFYNCIHGRDTCPNSFMSDSPLISGNGVPSSGDTSHSNFHRDD